MYCRNCGAMMNDNQAICLKCGVAVGTGSDAFCPNCGNPTQPFATVCVNCGVALNKGPVGGLAGQDKTTMALICFFLGGLGIHNFMMGEKKKGIFKIIMSLCCGIGEILAFIDFIKILMDKYVVDTTALI